MDDGCCVSARPFYRNSAARSSGSSVGASTLLDQVAPLVERSGRHHRPARRRDHRPCSAAPPCSSPNGLLDAATATDDADIGRPQRYPAPSLSPAAEPEPAPSGRLQEDRRRPVPAAQRRTRVPSLSLHSVPEGGVLFAAAARDAQQPSDRVRRLQRKWWPWNGAGAGGTRRSAIRSMPAPPWSRPRTSGLGRRHEEEGRRPRPLAAYWGRPKTSRTMAVFLMIFPFLLLDAGLSLGYML